MKIRYSDSPNLAYIFADDYERGWWQYGNTDIFPCSANMPDTTTCYGQYSLIPMTSKTLSQFKARYRYFKLT